MCESSSHEHAYARVVDGGTVISGHSLQRCLLACLERAHLGKYRGILQTPHGASSQLGRHNSTCSNGHMYTGRGTGWDGIDNTTSYTGRGAEWDGIENATSRRGCRLLARFVKGQTKAVRFPCLCKNNSCDEDKQGNHHLHCVAHGVSPSDYSITHP